MSFHDNACVQYLPADFRWPSKISCKQMWDLWYFGNHLKRIRPYKDIAIHDLQNPTDRVLRQRASVVMGYLENIVRPNLPEGCNSIFSLAPSMNDHLFNNAYAILKKTL